MSQKFKLMGEEIKTQKKTTLRVSSPEINSKQLHTTP